MLLDEESSISQRRAYTVTHAHELAHMWFGDLVTPKWWNDIGLNESFATWMMNKVSDQYWQEGEFDRETLKGALGGGMAPLLRKIIAEYAATGLPPAYLPKDECPKEKENK